MNPLRSNADILSENKKFMDEIAGKINNLPCWATMIVFLAVGIIIVWIVNFFDKLYNSSTEGFEQESRFILKENDDVFEDPFYVGIYDELFYKKLYNSYEVGIILNEIHPTSKDVVIEIGSKTGSYTSALQQSCGCNVIGLDKSKAMVEYASKRHPNSTFIQGDPMDFMSFSSEYATAILLLDFAIYYIKDRRTLFYNCYHWLKPGGYLILHLVNRHMFDTIVPAAKQFTLVSPQSVAKKRITTSDVVFKNFDYKSKFEFDQEQDTQQQQQGEGRDKVSDSVTFIETMKDRRGKVRKNIRSLRMSGQKIIIGEAKDAGFTMLGQYDLIKSHREYQYIYILYKPSN
jgi:ubiquinone/menaquinone biosynthesis C-methylase UbiE